MSQLIQKSQLAYLAGIIDGEGSITLLIDGSPKWPKRTTISPSVNVANNSEELIRYIAGLFGGSCMRTDRQKFARKPLFMWGLRQQEAVRELLPQLLPYLIVKKKQAELVLRWFNIRIDRRFGRTHETPLEELRIVRQVLSLNKTNKQRKDSFANRLLDARLGPDPLVSEASR